MYLSEEYCYVADGSLCSGFSPIYFVLFYVNYLFLIPNLLFKNKPYYFFIAECLLLLFLAIVLHFEQELLFDAPKEIFNRNVPPPPPRSAFLGRHFIVMCFVAGLSIVIRIALRWQSIEEKLVRIEREKMDSELKNLKNCCIILLVIFYSMEDFEK